MSTPAATHFVFVDFENVPTIDLGAIARQPVHVTLLIGRNQKKIDLELVVQIQALASQVKLVEVGASGHNALDLTLACYLGRAVERVPTANFAIVSKDKDFAPMIAHLRAHDVAIDRYDSFNALPFLTNREPARGPKSAPAAKSGGAAVKKAAEDRTAKVIARLKNPSNRNRPSDGTALRAYIKTALGKQASDAKIQSIVQGLRDTGTVIMASGGAVTYPVNLQSS